MSPSRRIQCTPSHRIYFTSISLPIHICFEWSLMYILSYQILYLTPLTQLLVFMVWKCIYMKLIHIYVDSILTFLERSHLT
jgi:hypothetical protein